MTTVLVQRRIAGPPERAWHGFVEEVDRWWGRDARYRTLADSTVRFERDSLVEVAADSERRIATVVASEPPSRLELLLGEDPVTIRFLPDGDGTKVVVEARRPAHLTAFQSPVGLFWADALAALGRSLG